MSTDTAPEYRAQRWLFAGPSDLISQDLYAEILRGTATRERSRLTVEPSSAVTGNAYFGRFPASYWQRWTCVPAVAVQLKVSGDGRLLIGASDMAGDTRYVASRRVTGAQTEPVMLTAPLDRFFDGGGLWVEAETGVGQRLIVEDVWWTVRAPVRPRPAAATICTMNRAEECLATLNALAADPVALDRLEAIWVVDQGTDRVETHDGYPPVARQLGGRLRYITQPNLGGAGGFTRGLYEVESEQANVLFMDDDVLLEPDLIVRMTAFSASTAQPLILGGQMLNLLHPTQLHAGAEYTDLDAIRPGVPVPHSPLGADLLAPDPVTGRRVRQDRRLDAGYNGWWACHIPYEVVKEIGYPLPLFFQGDDAEYSYRARAHGFPTVTLPGAGLWHTEFSWKDRDELNRYFILRNYTIISALHGEFPIPFLIRTLVAELVPYLLGMQYGAAATLIAAVEDFLKGPDTLRDGGIDTLARIRELRAAYPETRCHQATSAPGIDSNDIVIVNAPGRPRARDLAPLLGIHRAACGAIPHDEAHWWHVARFRTAVVTDASQKGVRVRRYDRHLMTTLAKAGARALTRLAVNGGSVRDQYRRALPELSSRTAWARLYRIEGE